jgi:predicted nucleic-acid-binding Zn-ribbon protein
MSDMRLDFDDYADVCPICKEIVEIESWPKIIDCAASLDDPECVSGRKMPPCPVCGSEDLEQNWLTLPNKRQRGMTHNWILCCPSCGCGNYHDGTDALTGRVKIVARFPPEYDFEASVRAVEVASDEESRERALQHKEECLHLQGFFLVRGWPCLDDGWDNLGYGVRPLDRTDIMQRFYIWTNKQAVGEATEAENPLRRAGKSEKRKKRGEWW